MYDSLQRNVIICGTEPRLRGPGITLKTGGSDEDVAAKRCKVKTRGEVCVNINEFMLSRLPKNEHRWASDLEESNWGVAASRWEAGLDT